MSYWRTCPKCGWGLKPGEKCDCRKYKYFFGKTERGSRYITMEIREGETPIGDVSEVCRTPRGNYIMHIVRPQDRLECFAAIWADEIGCGVETIEMTGNFECIAKIAVS